MSSIDTFAADIQKILDEYGEKAGNLTKESVRKIGRKGVQALKSGSGVFKGSKYASGWSSKIEETRMGAKATLYNSKLPGLPHLLEHGHANRGGGRTPGRVHIKPVEDELIEAFENDLERSL